MNIIETIVLGAVQGLTEFIPVSSSGHLVLFQNLFNGASDHLFLEYINIGTVLALVVYFRKRLVRLGKQIIEQKKYSIARNILITSVPAGIVGYLASDFIAREPFFCSVFTVLITLAVVGFIMIAIEKFSLRKDPSLTIETLSWKQALVIGLTQMFALIPGVSRSGSTIIAGRLVGMTPAAAAEYSFIASLPIMLAVTAKLFLKSSDRAYMFDNLSMLIVGNIAAFVAGMLAIGFLMKYLQRNSLALFGWYRLLLALAVVVVLLIQFR